MNIRRFIAVALAAAFAVTAAAAENNDGKKFNLGLEKIQLIKKKGLKKENAELKAELDSLRMEVEKYRKELEYTDNIAGDMLEMYEENELKGDTGLDPEDYTAEVSESQAVLLLLHKILIVFSIPTLIF